MRIGASSDVRSFRRNGRPWIAPLTEAKAREYLRGRFEACYPFHPATLSVFQRKWQALSQYQQTRGTLAMLAQWISWASRTGFTEARREPLSRSGLHRWRFRTSGASFSDNSANRGFWPRLMPISRGRNPTPGHWTRIPKGPCEIFIAAWGLRSFLNPRVDKSTKWRICRSCDSPSENRMLIRHRWITPLSRWRTSPISSGASVRMASRSATRRP